MAQYVYNGAVHASSNMSPLGAAFGYYPDFDFIWNDEKCADVPAARERIQTLWDERDRMAERLRDAQKAQAEYHNKKTKPQHYEIGDKVMLSTKNLMAAQPKKKLSYKYTGPFSVADVIEAQAYRLQLPDHWRIHSVFHISLLESYYQNSNTVEPTQIILVSEDEK